MADGSPPGESIIGLARQLVRGLLDLAKLELTRGRQEIGAMLAESKAGAIRLGIAVLLLFLAVVALVDFIIQGIAALSGLPAWLTALLVFVVLAGLAGLFAWRGIRRIRIGEPKETIAAVKEDVAWAKRLLRRG
jgi:hypothetical protein